MGQPRGEAFGCGIGSARFGAEGFCLNCHNLVMFSLQLGYVIDIVSDFSCFVQRHACLTRRLKLNYLSITYSLRKGVIFSDDPKKKTTHMKSARLPLH